MTMGIPGGSVSGTSVNRDFNDLWLRFVSSVSSLVRQNDVEKLLRAPVPAAIDQQQVRKAARDLARQPVAARLRHGLLRCARPAVADQLDDLPAGDHGHHGVSERVTCGRSSTRSRRLNWAVRGTARAIGCWRRAEQSSPLAAHQHRTVTTPLSTPHRHRRGHVRHHAAAVRTRRRHRPTTTSSTPASSGWRIPQPWTTTVDQMSQPRETPVMTSRPIQIPSIAREMLEALGLGMGIGTRPRRHARETANGVRRSTMATQPLASRKVAARLQKRRARLGTADPSCRLKRLLKYTFLCRRATRATATMR